MESSPGRGRKILRPEDERRILRPEGDQEILRPEGERKLAGGVSRRISGKAGLAPEGRWIGVDIALLSPLPGQESLLIVSGD